MAYIRGLMILLVLVQVVARYVFSSPPSWTEEAARYCMIWAGLLGATAAFYQQGDPVLVRPEMASRRIGHPAAKACRAAAVLLFAGPVVVYGVAWVIRQSDRVSDALHLNLAYAAAVVPLSFSVIVLHAIAGLFGDEAADQAGGHGPSLHDPAQGPVESPGASPQGFGPSGHVE